MVIGKLRRVGNSLVLTVPRPEVQRLRVAEGDLVQAELTPLEVTPAPRPQVKAAIDRVMPSIQSALEYLKDR